MGAGSASAARLGAWAVLPTSLSAEMLSRAGFDYVCIDMQHGLADFATTVAMIQAIDLGSARPVVRVPWNEPGIIGRVLDAGALDVIVPMIDDAASAQAAVAACRYSPEGTRSAGPTRVTLRDGPGYVAGANAVVGCLPMVESVKALSNLDAILSTHGVDTIYVGPSDLSVSLGLGPGNHDGEEPFDAALAQIVEACRRHGVIAGIQGTPELAARRLEQGFGMVTVLADFQLLRATAEASLRSLR